MAQSGEAIKVVVFEDHESWKKIAKEELEALGCVVMAVVDNLVVALTEVIPMLETWGVSYALVDGNLTGDDGYDGRAIVERIRKVAPSVKTIGFSAMDQNYVDHELGKANFKRDALKKILAG